MITEHALLEVVPGREDEFVEAMEQAKALIAASPGFVSLRVERCLERPSCFLLLVEWERLEDHTEGFRARRPTRSGGPRCTTSTTRSRWSSTSRRSSRPEA